MVSMKFKLVKPLLDDTFRRQTSNCDPVDFLTKMLLLAETYTLVQVLLAIVTSHELIIEKENQD